MIIIKSRLRNQTKNEGARLTATFNNLPFGGMSCRLLTRHWTHVWFPLRRNKNQIIYEIYCCMADRDSFASRLDGTSICADARTYADGYVGYAASSPVGYIDGA